MRSHPLRLTVSIAVLALLTVALPAAALVPISQCGEVVPPGETALLVADLDCRDSGTEGVVLSHRSRLLLAGHQLLGDPLAENDDGAPLQGVRCKTGTVCRVEGPGSIVGFSGSGVAGTRVRLADVVIMDNGRAGVSAFENVRLHDVVVTDNATVGVRAGGRVRAGTSEITEHPEAEVVEWRSPQQRPHGAHAN